MGEVEGVACQSLVAGSLVGVPAGRRLGDDVNGLQCVVEPCFPLSRRVLGKRVTSEV